MVPDWVWSVTTSFWGNTHNFKSYYTVVWNITGQTSEHHQDVRWAEILQISFQSDMQQVRSVFLCSSSSVSMNSNNLILGPTNWYRLGITNIPNPYKDLTCKIIRNKVYITLNAIYFPCFYVFLKVIRENRFHLQVKFISVLRDRM